MKTVFFVDSVIEFEGDTWEREPCPGSELAVIHVARALAERGAMDVHVVCRTRRPGCYNDVHYHALGTESISSADAVVHVRRYWERRLDTIASGRRLLWLQDTSAEILSLARGATSADLRASLARFDALVFVSEWHKAEVLSAAGLFEDEVLAAAFYQPVPAAPPTEGRMPARLIHTAHPRKALADVLRAWPFIAEARADAELILCGHPAIYQESTFYFNGRQITMTEAVSSATAGAKGRVTLMPHSFPQRDLLSVVASASICLHPDASVETGATTVLEAMSVGTVPAVSDLGCLPELCASRGVITPREGPDFAKRFAADVVALMTDGERRLDLSRRARAFAADKTAPAGLAAQWTALLTTSPRVLMPSSSPAESKSVEARSFSIVSAASISPESWSRFCSLPADVWITHTRDWYLIERSAAKVLDQWFGVIDDRGELSAIVPLVLLTGEPKVVLSGLIEPSGPCFRPDLSQAQEHAVGRVIVDAMLDRARRGGASEVVLKLAALSQKGIWHAPKGLLASLRLARFAISESSLLVVASEDWPTRISRRTRTQINSARRRFEIARAATESDLSTACALYCDHAARRGTFALRKEELRSCLTGQAPRSRIHIASADGRAAGFTIAFELGESASLFAWGIVPEARGTGLSQALVFEALADCFSRGITRVECGGGFGAMHYEGIDEFYRRIGAKHVPAMMAERRLIPKAAREIRYVVR